MDFKYVGLLWKLEYLGWAVLVNGDVSGFRYGNEIGDCN